MHNYTHRLIYSYTRTLLYSYNTRPSRDAQVAVHSSKAIGEPPFFLGASVFFAINDAVRAARAEHLGGGGGGGGGCGGEGGGIEAHFALHSPATSERIRLACADRIAAAAVGADRVATFQPKGSF